MLASRLSEDSEHSVLLLEAGGDDMGEMVLSVPFLYALAQHSKHDWDLYTVKQDNAFLAYKEEVSFYNSVLFFVQQVSRACVGVI